jgi:hypothetical protein
MRALATFLVLVAALLVTPTAASAFGGFGGGPGGGFGGGVGPPPGAGPGVGVPPLVGGGGPPVAVPPIHLPPVGLPPGAGILPPGQTVPPWSVNRWRWGGRYPRRYRYGSWIDDGRYRQPPPPPPQAAPPPEKLFERMEEARSAFRKGAYDEAKRVVEGLLKEVPDDVFLQEFLGLIRFAGGAYADAAAAVRRAVGGGGGWDWSTLGGFYEEPETYVEQLRKLEARRWHEPEDLDARLLLGYHYLVTGHLEAATEELAALSKKAPRDPAVKTLLRLAKGGEPEQGGAKTDPPPAAPSFRLVGEWEARSPDEGLIEATFDANGGFTWTYRTASKRRRYAGRYTIRRDRILLEEKRKGPVVATMKPDGDLAFELRIVGEEKVLRFARVK